MPNRWNQDPLHLGTPVFKPSEAAFEILRRLADRHPDPVDSLLKCTNLNIETDDFYIDSCVFEVFLIAQRVPLDKHASSHYNM